MHNDIRMLNHIRQTTHMGQLGIRSIMDDTRNHEFRAVLQSQLQEYDSIFQEADRLLRERGGSIRKTPAPVEYGTRLASKFRVQRSEDTTSKIAEMMLQGSTKGMIKSMQNIRSMGILDPKVSSLSNRLLQTEQANIDQMKQYL